MGGAYQGQSLDANSQECVNLYLETDRAGGRTALIATPGLQGKFILYDANGICRTQAKSGAGTLLCNGELYGQGFANDFYLMVRSTGNDSGVTFSITGIDRAGAQVTDSFLGSDSGVAYSTETFYSIVSISVSGALAGSVTIGASALATLPAWFRGTEIRCLRDLDGVLYAVIGNLLVSITTGGIVTALNDHAMNTWQGIVTADDNGRQIMFCDGTLHLAYLYDASDSTWTRLNESDYEFLGGGSVTYFNGYFLSHEPGTNKVYFSGFTDELSDGLVWDALDYLEANSNSSDIVRVLTDRRELWVFKTDITEIFYSTGDADAPFARRPGGSLDAGCLAVGSPVVADNSVFWLAHDRTVRRATGYNPQVISTPGIAYRIGQYQDASDAVGYSYSLNGRIHYMLVFPTGDDTWSFESEAGNWIRRASYVTDTDRDGRYRGNAYTEFNNWNLVADYENGIIYELRSDVYTENLKRRNWLRRAQVIQSQNNMIFYGSLEIEFESGVGRSTGVRLQDVMDTWNEVLTGESTGTDYTGDGSITLDDVTAAWALYQINSAGPCAQPRAALRYSNDGGHTWVSEGWREIGRTGEYSRGVRFDRLGSAKHRVFEIHGGDPVKTVILGTTLRAEGGLDS